MRRFAMKPTTILLLAVFLISTLGLVALILLPRAPWYYSLSRVAYAIWFFSFSTLVVLGGTRLHAALDAR
jgi:hypothetical protein